MARGGGGAEDGWRSPPGTHRSPTMHTTRSRSPFETTLQGVAGQLVERVAALPGNAGRPQLLRWLLAIGALFVAWRLWRGLKSLFSSVEPRVGKECVSSCRFRCFSYL